MNNRAVISQITPEAFVMGILSSLTSATSKAFKNPSKWMSPCKTMNIIKAVFIAITSIDLYQQPNGN